jgi:hypothetical protein
MGSSSGSRGAARMTGFYGIGLVFRSFHLEPAVANFTPSSVIPGVVTPLGAEAARRR